ncbi:DUF6339 family protein [Streptosporangium sp. NPDC087985]|uniref:DUF6339 family protein n=1 Tax=Streptosporangium sp. NPDC087985 TaxID=3366196 RepID=UPI003826E064
MTFPQRIALLPDSETLRFLTSGVLDGKEQLPQALMSKACQPLDDSPRWETRLLRDFIDEAMRRFGDGPSTAADAWLAPRLHAILRITRREAADAGLWNFLSMRLAPDYVFWRHIGRAKKSGDPQTVNSHRFCGPFHTQAFARLWWAAELFRDGDDYSPVELACGNQDVFNTVLRMEIIHHRPTAQALIQLMGQGTIKGGREVNAAAAAVNATASTLLFEVLAPDDQLDSEARRAWMDDGETAVISYDRLPDGPDDGTISGQAVNALLPLFEKLFSEAPVRGRTNH